MGIIEKIKGKKKLLCTIGVSIIITGCLWAFISASVITHKFKDKIENQDYSAKEANIESLVFTETKDGEKLWELYADSGMYSDTDATIILDGIIGNFYDENKVKASFKSDKGTYNSETKEINLYDNILMVYQDGTNIKAKKLEYKGKDKDITAEGNVEIEKPGEAVIKGNKAVLSGDYKNFNIEGRTETKFYM